VENKYVVAIGSSAGGLSAMKTFFDNTPHDQATYVILRHLPVDYKSQLQEILQRHSKLRILEAADNTLIEKDTVYIPPASAYMTITRDRLFLKPRKIISVAPNWSVNIFLQSLANSKGNKSIAIILSGAGSDGAKGVTSIKNAGGMVIAQNLQSCEFRSMPYHAIKTGMVDYQLAPSEMPHFVLQHIASILKPANLVKNLKKISTAED
jgi:two-component system CheB/CheR fusion protein